MTDLETLAQQIWGTYKNGDTRAALSMWPDPSEMNRDTSFDTYTSRREEVWFIYSKSEMYAHEGRLENAISLLESCVNFTLVNAIAQFKGLTESDVSDLYFFLGRLIDRDLLLGRGISAIRRALGGIRILTETRSFSELSVKVTESLVLIIDMLGQEQGHGSLVKDFISDSHYGRTTDILLKSPKFEDDLDEVIQDMVDLPDTFEMRDRFSLPGLVDIEIRFQESVSLLEVANASQGNDRIEQVDIGSADILGIAREGAEILPDSLLIRSLVCIGLQNRIYAELLSGRGDVGKLCEDLFAIAEASADSDFRRTTQGSIRAILQIIHRERLGDMNSKILSLDREFWLRFLSFSLEYCEGIASTVEVNPSFIQLYLGLCHESAFMGRKFPYSLDSRRFFIRYVGISARATTERLVNRVPTMSIKLTIREKLAWKLMKSRANVREAMDGTEAMQFDWRSMFD